MSGDEAGRPFEESLLGREVGVSVSEPWDFEYPGGARLLTGRVADIGAESAEQGCQWVLVALDTPFVSDATGAEISRLKATRRHVSDRGIFEQILSGDHPSANLSYAEQVPKERMPARSYPFLIGTIALRSAWPRNTDPNPQSTGQQARDLFARWAAEEEAGYDGEVPWEELKRSPDSGIR